MSSPHVANMLSAYIDGDLSVDERKQVERHLENCEACAEQLHSLRQTVGLIRSIPMEEPPSSLHQSVMQAIRAEVEASPTGRRAAPPTPQRSRSYVKRWMRPLTWAAAVVLLIGAGYIGSWIKSENSTHISLGRGVGSSATEFSADGEMSVAGGPVAGGPVMDGSSAAAPPVNSADWSRQESGAQVMVASDSMETTASFAARKIIQRGRAEIEVEDVSSAFRTVVRLVEVRGGYVEDSSVFLDPVDERPNRGIRTPKGDHASLLVRVPATDLENFMEELDQVGTVRNASISGDDITDHYVDSESRLRNLKAQELRYLEVLQQADTVDEILRVENELWRVRGNIETLQGQLNHWDRMIAMASASIDLRPFDSGQLHPLSQGLGNRLARAVRDSLDAALSGVEYIIVGAGALLPWVLLGVLIWLGFRRLAFQRSKSGPET